MLDASGTYYITMPAYNSTKSTRVGGGGGGGGEYMVVWTVEVCMSKLVVFDIDKHITNLQVLPSDDAAVGGVIECHYTRISSRDDGTSLNEQWSDIQWS